MVAVALCLALTAAHAQDNPDDQYIIIYTLIQQGDTYVDSGQPQRALESYKEAQGELQKFQQVYSDWNPRIVDFRMNYLAQKIAALTPQTPATNPPPQAATPAPADLQAQINSLNTQIHQLQSDNQTLQSKLKEALSVQPAAVSPDAFAQLQAQANALAKENELLKATAAQAAKAPPQGNPQLQQSLDQETVRANQLAQQNQTLQARLNAVTLDADSVEALREENALLKKELANMNSSASAKPAAPTNPTIAQNDTGDMAAARNQIVQLESEASANWLEKVGLENRIRQMQEASVNAAMADTTPNESPEALAQQVDTLRARVAVDEAPAVSYTPQELALFQPEAVTANTEAAKKGMNGGTAVLVAEAQNYYTNREYDKAASDYQQVLRSDPNNAPALASLAAAELEQNKTADADKHIQAALAQDPNDPFNLTVLGRVKFAQGNYDDSLDALGRAAKLDPQNAQIQNFLGVALAEKGLRPQAETAFRKAVQLEPEYGDAHKNLAIIYLGATPPNVELARWHYEKALADGVPASPDLEKMLSQGGTTGSSQ